MSPPPSNFVGTFDILHIHEQPDSRLITLVGPGGIGKTLIAIQTASDQLNRFSDGVYFIPLAQLDDPAYIPATILDALALQAPAAQYPQAYLLDYLRDNEDATLLWGAAESLRERYNSPLPPSYQESYNFAIMEVRARLGETDFKRVWAERRATPLEHIIARVNGLSV